MTNPTNFSAYGRMQRLLGHVDGISAPPLDSISLESNSCASTTGVFGPSDRTFAVFNKIQATLKSSKNNKATTPESTTATHVPDSDIALHDDSVIKPRDEKAFDTACMQSNLDVFFPDERANVFKVMSTQPSFKHFHSIGQTLPEQREIIQQQVKDFVAHCNTFQFTDIIHNPLKWISHLEMLYYHSCTVATKAGVHFGLFGATVMNLGNESHRQFFAKGVHSLDIRGCFCLTELGHGSNAREIETTATYDHATQEYVLNTPTETAQKIFIGNLAQHGNWAVVFAQLIVGTQQCGVHAFVIQIRDKMSEKTMPHVRILDCGPKTGLNGVDNGRLWLDGYRAPKSSLLNKFGDVNEAGQYVSSIESPIRRFTATIGQLVGGRIIVGQGAVHQTKVGLSIAIRYAFTRTQFGPPGRPEIPIMNFLTHQLRLMPLLAKTYALQFAFNRLKEMYQSMLASSGSEKEELSKELHVLAAGLKPIATWHKNEALQMARECCGGLGFMAVNRIAILRNDSDIDMTWEGDNTVLLQQVSASLLKEFKDQFQTRGGASAKFRGLLKYLEVEAAFSWQTARANPLARPTAGKRTLRAAEFYLRAFRFREGRLLRALVHRLGAKPAKESGSSPRGHPKPSQFDAWNNAGDLVNELARAHVDRQLIEAFVAVIDRLDQPTASESEASLVPVLRSLCSLFALSTIQKNLGFYLTFRFFSAETSKKIWPTINHLCQKIAPISLQLVDSFGIPEFVLSAPIAGDWKAAYSYPNVPGYVDKKDELEARIN